MEETQIKALADNLWHYFEPKIRKCMENSISYYRAEVTANPGGNRLKVQRPFDSAVTIPCVDFMANAAVGDQVLVMVFGNGTNSSNSVVIGDGALHSLGGVENPLPISNGGTGADTADGARGNLLNLGYINGDLNSMTSIGASWCNFGSCTNAPFSSGYGYVIRDFAYTCVTQTAFRYNGGMIYRRNFVNGQWTAWKNNFDVGNNYVTSYPTSPGIYRLVGVNVFQHMTPNNWYGVLIIFQAAYSVHIYVDTFGTMYYGAAGSDTLVEPGTWYRPSVTQQT